MECEEEKKILLATSIAMELAKGLDIQELEELRNFVGQIQCSISSLIACKICKQRQK